MDNQLLVNAALAKLLGKDPVREESRVKVRIRTRVLQYVVAGTVVDWSDGTPVNPSDERDAMRDIVIEVFESDLPKLQALVETFVDKNGRRIGLEAVDQRYADDLADWTEGTDGNAGRPADQFPGSWERAFRALFRRDPKPFFEAEPVRPASTKRETAKS